MSNRFLNDQRSHGIDAKDVMILKGLMMGKSLREIQTDILAKSHNTVQLRINDMIDGGYIKPHEHYSRNWELTDKGREELRKYIS